MFVVVAFLASVVPGFAADKPTIQDILSKRTTLVSDDESFESVLLALERNVKRDHPEFNIKILADDLKKEGITKNQRIRGLKLEDMTIAEILTAIVLKGSPGSTVTNPADPKLKLVWLIESVEGRHVPTILIATRDGAKKRGQKLPEVFDARQQ